MSGSIVDKAFAGASVPASSTTPGGGELGDFAATKRFARAPLFSAPGMDGRRDDESAAVRALAGGVGSAELAAEVMDDARLELFAEEPTHCSP
jgi:hypothetical protein